LIAITHDKALRLTPRKGSDKPELEFPLQFGYVCPECGHVIHGAFNINDEKIKSVYLPAYAEGTWNHQYPLSYTCEIVELVTGIRSQLFWEDGHFVTGYDPYHNTQGKTRCKFSRGWHHRSPRVVAGKLWKDVTQSMYVYVNTTLSANFRNALAENPAICLPFLERLEADHVPNVFTQAKDVTGNSNPIYLLARTGLTSSQLEAILNSVLANS
jgi:hypothetical protein